MLRIRKELSIILCGFTGICMLIDLFFFKYTNNPKWIFNIIVLVFGFISGIIIGYNIAIDNGWIEINET